jgi:hypothetical protein
MRQHSLATFNTLAAVASFLLATATLAGPAKNETSSLEYYTRFASDPVPSFLLRDFRNWELLDGEHVLVHSTHREAWLISVQRPCRGLNEAWHVEVGQKGSRVYANSDAVRFDTGSCRIDQIRRVDLALARQSAPSEEPSKL